MELINNFANLSKTLSEKFRLSKSEISLYLLALIHDASNLALYSEFMSPESQGNFLIEDGILDSNIFRAIKDSGLVNLGSFNKNEIREFSDYLITEYLKSANTSLSSLNLHNFLVELATESALELHSPDEEYTEWVTYISNIGTGNIVVKLLKKLAEKSILDGCGIVGNEPDNTLNFLSEINYFIHDINENLLTTSASALTGLGDNYSVYGEVQIAISLPPFTNIQQRELQKLYEFLGSTEKIYFSELAYIELMLKRVSERGKVIAVVRNDFLTSRKSKVFREKYLKNDWVEKIIALPREFINYPIDISVIVFNKTKLEKGFVVFDGSEDKFEKTKIGIEDIISNDFDLRVAHYASNEAKELKSVLSKYPQDEIKKIKDLIDSSISGFNYSPKNRIVENSSDTLPYVRITDLAKNGTQFDLDISKVERKISREKAHKIIDFSAVLVSKIAPKIKPTYFNFTGQPIVIGSDVIALKTKENVNIEYFITQLHSPLVQIQVEIMSSGTTINRISTEDFLDFQILLPSLEEQQREISAIRGLISEKAIAEEKVIDAQYEVVANINHSLKNKLAVIINDYDTLVRFLRRKERNNETINFANPISANAVGDDIDTIEIVTERLKTNLLDASKVFKNAEKIQKQTLNKEVVELVRFFTGEVKPLYLGKNYSIEVIAKPNLELNVWLDKDAFKDVIENLIENAKCHGFINNERNYRIMFELSELEDADNVDEETSTKFARIIYKNDGKPFPRNFSFEDYKQFSNKAGKTQGTGIGGYVINKMIELHDGRFNFISPSDDFTVEFEILLPLEN